MLCSGPLSVAASAQPVPVIINPNEYQNAPGFISDPAGAVRRAREKIAAGDLEGAVDELAVYVAGHPREIGPARFLGDLYYRLGRFDRAEGIYLRLLYLNPYDKETHNRLGVVYATENRINDAIDQFDRALPGTDSVSDLVAMHLRKGDLAVYQSDMVGLAGREPSNPDIQAEVGQIFSVMHKPADAMGYYMRALDSDPESLTALNGLGLAYLDLHNPQQAELNFKKCLALDPPNYTCENNLGATYLQSGRDAEAKEALTRAHDLEPERPEALVNFGYLADLHGNWKGAIKYYVQATVVGPYLPEAYVDLGIDYEHNNLYQLAEASLLKGVAAAPHDGRIRYLLAVAYVAEGKQQLALEQLKAAKDSLDPDVARIAEEESARLAMPPMTSPTPQLLP